MVKIWSLYLKYLDNYLETLHSHFQPNCHFKMFQNSGSEFDAVFSLHCTLPQL
jgi:hypothetical protein